ncbi:MAG TPA: tetratricopeptide repeat protein [Pyrinomonadaceae bacterium]|jgi:tetratricopeptide (TPR) repeat protein
MSKGRFYRFITIAILSFSLVSCAPKAGTEPLPAPVDTAPIGETVAKCDALFKERSDSAKLREAVKLLAAARNPDARSYEVEWKFAKYSYFLGKRLADEKEKEKAFEDGKAAGRIASRMEPNKADGYFWYAANLGEQSKLSPVTVGVKSVDEIKEAMNKVLEIDPKYQNGSAYDGLAQIELSTAGLMGGKPEKAVEYLQKGLAIEDDNSYLHLHLAEAYLATGKRDEARKQLEYVLKMKPNPDYVPEHAETVERAKKLLETKF